MILIVIFVKGKVFWLLLLCIKVIYIVKIKIIICIKWYKILVFWVFLVLVLVILICKGVNCVNFMINKDSLKKIVFLMVIILFRISEVEIDIVRSSWVIGRMYCCLL